jgi:hypothetical protein
MSGPTVDWATRCEPLRRAMADPNLTGMERRVFTIMWTFTGPDGDGARPGVDLLAEMLNANARNIRDAINGNQSRGIVGLIRRGYLVVTEKPNRRGGRATTYGVRVPGDEAISASQSRAKDESLSARRIRRFTASKTTLLARHSHAPRS